MEFRTSTCQIATTKNQYTLVEYNRIPGLHNTSFAISRMQSKITRCIQTQDNLTHFKREKVMKADHMMTQMLELEARVLK